MRRFNFNYINQNKKNTTTSFLKNLLIIRILNKKYNLHRSIIIIIKIM